VLHFGEVLFRMDFDDGFADEDINAANMAEEEYYNGGAAASAAGEASPANKLMTAIINVKKQVYAYFLDVTESTHEQNIDIMLSEYPAVLSKLEKTLTTVPINPGEDIEKHPASLKSSLAELQVALDEYILTDADFWMDNYKYMVRTLFIKYPYLMTKIVGYE